MTGKACYLIVGKGPHLAAADERTASTAVEAERLFYVLQRICGRFGTVSVFGVGGRPIGAVQLASLVREERGISRPKGFAGPNAADRKAEPNRATPPILT